MPNGYLRISGVKINGIKINGIKMPIINDLVGAILVRLVTFFYIMY